jgi:hypothetical protein
VLAARDSNARPGLAFKNFEVAANHWAPGGTSRPKSTMPPDGDEFPITDAYCFCLCCYLPERISTDAVLSAR